MLLKKTQSKFTSSKRVFNSIFANIFKTFTLVIPAFYQVEVLSSREFLLLII